MKRSWTVGRNILILVVVYVICRDKQIPLIKSQTKETRGKRAASARVIEFNN